LVREDRERTDLARFHLSVRSGILCSSPLALCFPYSCLAVDLAAGGRLKPIRLELLKQPEELRRRTKLDGEELELRRKRRRLLEGAVAAVDTGVDFGVGGRRRRRVERTGRAGSEESEEVERGRTRERSAL